MTKGQVLEKLYKIELSMRATLVINYLINRANKEMTCFPGIKTIASDCNMSTRTVQRALNDLEVSGIVKKESRWRDNGGQSSNLYVIDFDQSTKVKASIVEVEQTNNDLMIDEIDFREYKNEKSENELNEQYVYTKVEVSKHTSQRIKKYTYKKSEYSSARVTRNISCHRVYVNLMPP